MDTTNEIRQPLSLKRRLHAIIFSVCVVVLSATIMLGLGDFRTQANRQRGNFINQDFRNSSPNTGNIIYALRGDGTPGNTAYTRNWTGSCVAPNVIQVPASFAGGTGVANTIYIINSGNYLLTNNIVLKNCSALIAKGSVFINGANTYHLIISGATNVIVDGLSITGGNTTSFAITSSSNVSVNAVQGYASTRGMTINTSSYISLFNSQFYNNATVGIGIASSHNINLNNIMSYNNTRYGIYGDTSTYAMSINNSQSFNNNIDGIYLSLGGITLHNSITYNNGGHGLSFYPSSATGVLDINNSSFYNNAGDGIYAYTGNINFYGDIKLFDNAAVTGGSAEFFSPAPLLSRSTATIDTSNTIDYDRVTNPINTIDVTFFTGNTRSALRGVQTWDISHQPFRYIFGLNVLHQTLPVAYIGTGLVEYGNDAVDFYSSRFIAELEPNFVPAYMSLVNQYFGSGSWYTQNRSGNACSLGSFQIVVLNPGTYPPYTLQSHTIYMLNSGEYKFTVAGDGFTFGGNCIALIGSGNVRVDKYNSFMNNLISATDKRNLIIENLKIDGKYIANGNATTPTHIGINFAGTTYNTTINQIQSYNHSQYGIFLGIGSHHNSIINTQVYNNGEAGIYLYLASHHNVINNSMAYNNSGYGIRFANGSHRNAMNNFQSFNNLVGVFGDMTTKENIINRAMLYNNSQYGLLLKNSSGNILNDMQIYNNTTGIKIELNSDNNVYNGELKLFDNLSDLEGTTASDGYLNTGSVPPFAEGVLTPGSNLMDCSHVTNPTFSGSTTSLLDTLSGCMLTGQNYSVFNGRNTLITYLFGADIYKQTLPYRYDSTNSIEALPTQYDSGKYIAEIFAIRDTTLESVTFSFSGVIEPSTLYTSEVYTAQVINTYAPISLSINPVASTGYLVVNGVNVGSTGMVLNGDAIQIAMTSSADLNGIVTGTLVNNALTHTVLLQTKGPDELPSTGSFLFTDIVGAPLNIYTGSIVTVSDIDTGVLASINTGWIAIYSGSSLISSGSTGMVYSGNEILAMIASSSQYSSITTGVVIIGQGSGSFTTQTIPDIFSPILSFTDPVSSGAVATDIISVHASGNTSPVMYKFISNPGDCTNSGTTAYSGAITLTTEIYNGKYFCAYAELSGIALPLVSPYTVNIDHTAPSTPTLLYPADDTDVFFLVLEQTGSYDSGAGISGYEYMIADDYNFVDVISTGFFQTSGTSFSPNNFLETTGDFYRKIRTIDNIGLISARSNQGHFIAIDNAGFYFDEREYAALDTSYMSNEITIDGLRVHGMAIATVDEGTIYKNDIDKGQSTYVQNDDKIAIKLTSPHDYGESVVSVLTVANRSTNFVISTSPDANSCTLSTQDKNVIQTIYDNLVAQYTGNQNLYNEFLSTITSMLQDEIDLTNDCNLQYLQDLLNGNVQQNNLTGININNHIAPSCKEYHIGYDTGKLAYLSPDFKVTTYFANRDALTRYIDSKNPGDCHIVTSTNSAWYFGNTDPAKHVAPNGKLYTIQHEPQGYTSAQFSVKKYFSTISALRTYLNSKNPPAPVWNHTVDTMFAPVNFTAPNGKVYKIYKTNKGYMAYKLMNIKYYATLAAIKSFINKNNAH